MKYYTIQNGSLLIAENEQALTRFYDNVLPLPSDYNAEKYIVVNNELVLNPEWEEIQLNEAKEAKLKENEEKRDAFLVSGVLYKNILWDSDLEQKFNISVQVNSMGDEETITWVAMDGVTSLECTKADLLNIGALLTQMTAYVWQLKNPEIKTAIQEAKTVEEVEAISIDYSLTAL